MKTKILLIFASVMLAIFSANAENVINFSGKIGSYGVKGHVTIFGRTLVGDYKYVKSSGKLGLKGTSYSQGNNTQLIMTEVDNKGQESGYWDVIYNPSKRTVTGTMTTRKGKTYRVNLKTN